LENLSEEIDTYKGWLQDFAAPNMKKSFQKIFALVTPSHH
jgi:hypothetical protein